MPRPPASRFIWLCFGAIFLILGISHWEASKLIIEVTTREGISSFGMGLDEPLENFAREFNEISKKANQLAAVGYFVAFATALVSFVRESKVR